MYSRAFLPLYSGRSIGALLSVAIPTSSSHLCYRCRWFRVGLPASTFLALSAAYLTALLPKIYLK
ncbi:MAG: hypothetical protein QXH67_01205 [Candidatus Bathyarchaeia archaeon]